MSSILKALRKVEDEKATIGQGSVDLAHDILKRSYSEKKSSSTALFLLLICALLALLMTAGAWLFWPEKTPILNTLTTESVPAPMIPPLFKTEKQPQPSAQSASVQTPVSATAISEVKSREPAAMQRQESATRLPADAEPVPLIEIPPLRIDEIVYHQDPLSRLAVINDLPVMQGTDIDGAHVVEILPAEVVFSYQGIRFKKSLNGAP